MKQYTELQALRREITALQGTMHNICIVAGDTHDSKQLKQMRLDYEACRQHLRLLANREKAIVREISL